MQKRVAHGVCPNLPTTKRKIWRFTTFAGVGNIFFPSVLMGDVNDDGRSNSWWGGARQVASVDDSDRRLEERDVAVNR